MNNLRVIAYQRPYASEDDVFDSLVSHALEVYHKDGGISHPEKSFGSDMVVHPEFDLFNRYRSWASIPHSRI